MRCLPLRLEAPGLAPLILDSGPIIGARLDLGDAITREVVEVASDADGTIDTTALIGARVVTLEATISPAAATDGASRWALTQRLRAFTSPRLRPELYMRFSEDDPELVVTMRRSQFSDLWEPQRGQRSRVTVQWVAPYGILESAELHTATVNASGSPGGLGREYDLDFDRDYPADAPSGSVEVTNAGTIDAYPVLRLYGPWADETSIENLETGKALVFDGLTVAAGDFLEIDTRAKTILLNGDTSDSRFQYLVFPDSQWWTLIPGAQRIRFQSETFTAPAQAQIRWRDAYL